jgi:hypothetical protein
VSTHPGMTGSAGVTGPASQKSQRELEFEAGQRAAARHRGASPSVPPTKTSGPNNVFQFPPIHTGLAEAANVGSPTSAAQQSEPATGPSGPHILAGPHVTELTEPIGHTGYGLGGNTGATAVTGVTGTNAGKGSQSAASHSQDFLDDFFGSDKRHLVAIKKNNGKKPDIKARHFDAADRTGQQKFITDHGAAGFDIYFSPNPIMGTLHKKAKKNDVIEARHLWIDLDPRENEPLESERSAMLAQLTTNLPNGIPRPNRVIDSGRGYWGYWKLDKPALVDGAVYDDKGRFVGNKPLTDLVESYGKGIEQAFGDRFADGCRNIDRVARLAGTTRADFGWVESRFSDSL